MGGGGVIREDETLASEGTEEFVDGAAVGVAKAVVTVVAGSSEVLLSCLKYLLLPPARFIVWTRSARSLARVVARLTISAFRPGERIGKIGD